MLPSLSLLRVVLESLSDWGESRALEMREPVGILVIHRQFLVSRF